MGWLTGEEQSLRIRRTMLSMDWMIEKQDKEEQSVFIMVKAVLYVMVGLIIVHCNSNDCKILYCKAYQ